MSEDLLDKINKRSYLKKEIAVNYTSEDKLQKAEEVIFQRVRDEIRGKAVLDIGVGGGRTTKYLKEMTDNYVGIDYSPVMVEAAKAQYPGADIICRDARDMSIFEDSRFDLILFSFNGIDSVSHRDRIAILKEIFRLLKTDGYFIFSSHNRDRAGFNKFALPKLSLSPYRSLKTLVGLYNHIKNRRLEVDTDEYSIVNDSGHNYSLMHYYIGLLEQINQLKKIGFRGPFEAYDLDGNAIPIGVRNTSSYWIYYYLKK